MKVMTIADERQGCPGPGRTYDDEEAMEICREFVALVQDFCDRHETSLIGELLFSRSDGGTAMLFVMQGSVPARDEVDRAVANLLTEIHRYYKEHKEAR